MSISNLKPYECLGGFYLTNDETIIPDQNFHQIGLTSGITLLYSNNINIDITGKITILESGIYLITCQAAIKDLSTETGAIIIAVGTLKNNDETTFVTGMSVANNVIGENGRAFPCSYTVICNKGDTLKFGMLLIDQDNINGTIIGGNPGVGIVTYYNIMRVGSVFGFP